MSFGNLRSRIEELEQSTPGVVTFYFEHGPVLRIPGLALEIYNQAMAEIRVGRGPLREAVCRAAYAENFGRFLEVLKSLVN